MKRRFQKGDRVRVVRIVIGSSEQFSHLIGEEFEIARYDEDDIFRTPGYYLVGREEELWAESELELVEETNIPAAPPLSALFG